MRLACSCPLHKWAPCTWLLPSVSCQCSVCAFCQFVSMRVGALLAACERSSRGQHGAGPKARMLSARHCTARCSPPSTPPILALRVAKPPCRELRRRGYVRAGAGRTLRVCRSDKGWPGPLLCPSEGLTGRSDAAVVRGATACPCCLLEDELNGVLPGAVWPQRGGCELQRCPSLFLRLPSIFPTPSLHPPTRQPLCPKLAYVRDAFKGPPSVAQRAPSPQWLRVGAALVCCCACCCLRKD